VEIVALTFALVVGIVFGMYWLIVVHPERVGELALRKRMGSAQGGGQRAYEGFQREVARLSSVPALNRLLAHGSRLSLPLQRLIEQSGVKSTVGVLILSSACLGMIGVEIGQVWLHTLWLGMPLGVGMAWAPFLFLRWKRNRRVRRFEELFTEALDLMTRAMRAGHTFTTALGMVAVELPEPIAGEFKVLHDQQNFGMPIAEALKNFGERVPLLAAKFFVTAILTQRETGGNLTEVLDNLARVIRERFMVLRQVQVKSAHGRLTGWMLTAMPPALAILFTMIDPNHFTSMLEERLGMQMIVGAILLQVIGTLIIRKIVRVEY
jgi:tight adherence protein B